MLKKLIYGIDKNIIHFAAAGTFLFTDSTGHLLTAPAYQAISSLHRSDKIRRKQVLLALIRRAEQ
jgi:hypothetical protein